MLTINNFKLDKNKYIFGIDKNMEVSFELESQKNYQINGIYILYTIDFYGSRNKHQFKKEKIYIEKENIFLNAGVNKSYKKSIDILMPNVTEGMANIITELKLVVDIKFNPFDKSKTLKPNIIFNTKIVNKKNKKVFLEMQSLSEFIYEEYSLLSGDGEYAKIIDDFSIEFDKVSEKIGTTDNLENSLKENLNFIMQKAKGYISNKDYTKLLSLKNDLKSLSNKIKKDSQEIKKNYKREDYIIIRNDFPSVFNIVKHQEKYFCGDKIKKEIFELMKEKNFFIRFMDSLLNNEIAILFNKYLFRSWLFFLVFMIVLALLSPSYIFIAYYGLGISIFFYLVFRILIFFYKSKLNNISFNVSLNNNKNIGKMINEKMLNGKFSLNDIFKNLKLNVDYYIGEWSINVFLKPIILSYHKTNSYNNKTTNIVTDKTELSNLKIFEYNGEGSNSFESLMSDFGNKIKLIQKEIYDVLIPSVSSGNNKVYYKMKIEINSLNLPDFKKEINIYNIKDNFL